MKKFSMILVASMAAAAANAVVFADAVNDVNMPAGYFANQDITSVAVTNNGTSVSFAITLNAALTTDWGKYCIMIDSKAGGDTTSNGWGRSVGMPSGMDYWIGSWADNGGGHQVWAYNGSWAAGTNQPVSISGNTTTITVPLASLGLSMYDTFCFDVMSTGGGGNDSAWDLLSKNVVNDANNDLKTDWTEYTTSVNCLSYQVVPEPASMIALATGAAALLRRKKK